MNIPNFSYSKLIETSKEKFGLPSDDVYYFFQQLVAELQSNAGPEGLVVPTLSSNASSVTPPATGGQITAIEAGALNGTLVYDSNTDQLKVRLNDGTFHVITTV